LYPRTIEPTDKTAEIPDKTAEIPDKTAEIPDKTAEIPDKTAEIPDKTAGIPDETAGPIKLLEIPEPDYMNELLDKISVIPVGRDIKVGFRRTRYR
jgi:hypothetical protein